MKGSETFESHFYRDNKDRMEEAASAIAQEIPARLLATLLSANAGAHTRPGLSGHILQGPRALDFNACPIDG